MSAFNVVRMRVKPGFADEFLKFHREEDLSSIPGFKRMTVVQTGDRDFCFIGEWSGMEALSTARPAMIAALDQFRGKLEDLGGELGVTDPISGEAVIERRV
jgi:hypothetical protein